MARIIENVRETFQYLYWDICQYRGKDVAQVDQIILDFFDEVWPPSCVKGPVQTWDDLLRSLMESLLHHLGHDIKGYDVNLNSSLNCWVTSSDVKTPMARRPYVDWISLRSIIAPVPADTRCPHKVVQDILYTLETVYASRENDTVWSQKEEVERVLRQEPETLEAECANPIIRDFWNIHDVPYWGVCLHTPVNLHKTARGLAKVPIFYENDVRLNGDNILLICTFHSRLGLFFTPSPRYRTVTNVEITFSPPRSFGGKQMVIDRNILQQAKILYVGLLHWADAAFRTGKTPSLEDFLDVAGGGARDTSVDKKLWAAMRAYELNKKDS